MIYDGPVSTLTGHHLPSFVAAPDAIIVLMLPVVYAAAVCGVSKTAMSALAVAQLCVRQLSEYAVLVMQNARTASIVVLQMTYIVMTSRSETPATPSQG